ncbi:MAG: Grx4 family monothiol glutaredoxin [Gammaproteobacteria bacterium]
MDVMERIDSLVKANPVFVFMKGTPDFPQCGFSARAAQVLQACEVPFGHVNVLEDMDVFQNLPRYQNFPTFPQVYVGGELIGGSDIALEMYQKGELQEMIQQALEKAEG